MAREFMGTEPLSRLIPRLAAPTIAVSLVSLLYTIVDRIFIGHIEGTGPECLAALGICFPTTAFVTAFGAFAGNGASPLASIQLGANNTEKSRMYLSCATWLLIAFAICLMAAGYHLLDPMLVLFGCNESTLPHARDFLSVYLLGTPFVLASVGLTPFLAAQGDSRFALISAGIGAVANIALDALFIWVFNWGIRGAATANIIAQLLSALLVCAVLARRKSAIRLAPSTFRLPPATEVRAVLKLGSAPFFIQSTESLLIIVLNMLLSASGGGADYIACLTIMTSTLQLVVAPCSGFAQGATPVMSYSYGAGLIARVRQCIRVTCTVPWAFSFAVTILILAFPRQVVGIFTNDAQVVSLAAQLIPVYMAGMLVFGLQLGIQQVFMGLNRGLNSLAVATVRKLILFIPLAIVLTGKLGPFGVFLAEPISDTCSVIFCSALYLAKIPPLLRKAEGKGKR